MKNLERYFIDQEEEISILKDVDDNWNTDMVLAIERAAIMYNCTNRQVLRMLPLDKLVDYFIYSKIIPNIKKYDFIEEHFNNNWLDAQLKFFIIYGIIMTVMGLLFNIGLFIQYFWLYKDHTNDTGNKYFLNNVLEIQID